MAIRDILKAAFFTPCENGWGLPIAFFGGSGVAKTYLVREVARECGFRVEVISPGERGEGGVGCVPMPEALPESAREYCPAGMNSVLTYPAPDWSLPFFQSRRGVVFVDEVTTCPPAIQPALLSLFLEKRIGGVVLPRGVRPVAAYNPPEVAANGYDLPPPTANRMGHMKWQTPGADDHADFIVSSITDVSVVEDRTEDEEVARVATTDPAAEEARVLREWPSAAAEAGGLYAAFIRARPELLHQQPAADDPRGSGSWASPRTWSYAVRALATAKVHGLSDSDRDDMICCFVGEGPGGEFVSFIADQDLPDPRDVLDGKVKFSHDPARADRTHVVLAACSALVSPTDAEKRDERAKSLWKLLADICDAGAKDVAFPTAKRLTKDGHLRHVESRPVLKRLNKMMEAAGLKVS
jgi:hypothetical protein